MAIKLKRIYDPPTSGDGLRILVERLWPRGLSKGRARVDLWMKDLAPSAELRKWFSHDSKRWDEFRKRYFEELGRKENEVNEFLTSISSQTVTFVFASREPKLNNAMALKEFLDQRK